MAVKPVAVSSTIGIVPGQFQAEMMVCQYVHMTNSQGAIWTGGDPLAFSVPAIMAQFVVIILVSRTTYYFLQPLKQRMLHAQLIGGMIIGSSVLLGNKKFLKRLFPPGGRLTLETIANVGLFFHFFALGIQFDAGLLRKLGRSGMLIGMATFLVPQTLGILAMISVPNITILEDSVERSLPYIVMVNSQSSLPVISSLLMDLKILNSELGHLSVSASLVNDICCYSSVLLLNAMHVSIDSTKVKSFLTTVWIAAYLLFIHFILRPLILHIRKRIPEGQPMRESQFLSILMLVLLSGFVAESIGLPAGIGSFLLGMSIPDGLPLGSALVDKLDTLSTGILLPAKIVLGGMNVNLSTVRPGNSGVIIMLVLLVGYIGKFSGTFAAAISCGLPFWNCVYFFDHVLQGHYRGLFIYDILDKWEPAESGKGGGTREKLDETYLYRLRCRIEWKLEACIAINIQVYSIFLISVLIVTGLARPLIFHLYDPSSRYFSHKRNCILHSLPNSDLRVVVCIHEEDNVPPIISLLEVSHPSRFRPISVFVLNLLDLAGRGSATLKPNFPRKKLDSVPSRAGHIINVFSFFAECNQGFVNVQHFTAISPYASMHDDICTMALDKNAAIIIVPFHKKWTIDGTVGATFPYIRSVNRKVIRNAPCSVAILIDRGEMCTSQSILNCKISFRIAMLFIGGEDDREALVYASRMVEHPNVTLSLVWLRPLDSLANFSDKAEIHLHMELMNQFTASLLGRERINYKEEVVEDAVGTTRVLRAMEDNCDLFIVGRHHEPDSPLTFGLNGWGDCPELGVIGDVLATSDFRCSILVVAQQPPLLDSEDVFAHRTSRRYHHSFDMQSLA